MSGKRTIAAGSESVGAEEGRDVFAPDRLFWDGLYADGLHQAFWEPSPESEALSFLGGRIDWGRWCGKRILDLGCGTGAVLRAALESGAPAVAVGLDLSLEALSRANAAGPAAGMYWSGGRCHFLPFAEASFQLVVDRGVLHLFEGAARQRMAAEVGRVLVEGGHWVTEGAAQSDEDAGVFAVDNDDYSNYLRPAGFTVKQQSPSRLESPSGALDAVAWTLELNS